VNSQSANGESNNLSANISQMYLTNCKLIYYSSFDASSALNKKNLVLKYKKRVSFNKSADVIHDDLDFEMGSLNNVSTASSSVNLIS
jgi:hypothetical protein